MNEAPIEELQFLRKLQRLLAEGEFVATYKFALLNALADLCLELEPEPDGSPPSAEPSACVWRVPMHDCQVACHPSTI